MKKSFSSIPTLVLFLLVLLFSCQSDKKDTQTGNVDTFPVTHPILLDTVFAREYVGDIQSMQYVEIRARVGGFLERIHVDEGQEVRQGQLLFTLNAQEYREELRRAKAALNSALAEAKVAGVEVENTRVLVEKNIVGRPELNMSEARMEALQAKVEEARAMVSAAELTLSFTEVRAPFTGIINRQPFKAGSLVEEGELLTTISSNKDVFVYFNVSEKEYLEWMKRGDQDWKKNLSLQLANGQNHPHPGIIETAETVIDKNTGSLAFRARFPNPGHLLKHGASGKVLVYEPLKDVMVVPQKSTFDVQDKTYVFVVNGDNVAERRAFVPGLRIGDLYVVESGLAPTDRLIYEGIQRVREGSKVEGQVVSLRQVMKSLVSK